MLLKLTSAWLVYFSCIPLTSTDNEVKVYFSPFLICWSSRTGLTDSNRRGRSSLQISVMLVAFTVCDHTPVINNWKLQSNKHWIWKLRDIMYHVSACLWYIWRVKKTQNYSVMSREGQWIFGYSAQPFVRLWFNWMLNRANLGGERLGDVMLELEGL